MKQAKRILSWMMVAVLLFTMSGIAEELPAEVEIVEIESVEEPATEPVAEPVEEPVEVPADVIPEKEPVEVPDEVPAEVPGVVTDEEPAEEPDQQIVAPEEAVPTEPAADGEAEKQEAAEPEVQMPAPPVVAPGAAWGIENGNGFVIPCAADAEKVEIVWMFEGAAEGYALSMAPAAEPEARAELGYVEENRVELPVAALGNEWKILYIAAVLADGTQVEGAQAIRVDVTEVEPEGEEPESAEPEVTPPPVVSDEAVLPEEVIVETASVLKVRAEKVGATALQAIAEGGAKGEPSYQWQAMDAKAYQEALLSGEMPDAENMWKDIPGATGAELDVAAAMGEDCADYSYRCVVCVGDERVVTETQRFESTEAKPAAYAQVDIANDAGIAIAMTECEEYGHEWWDDDGNQLRKCAVCGADYCQTEGHLWESYTDNNGITTTTGICEVCGQKCSHGKTFERLCNVRNDTRPVPYDRLLHIVFENVYKVTTCAECGKALAEPVLYKQNARTIDFHDGVDKCAECGWSACKHERFEEYTVETYNERPEYVYVDEKTHKTTTECITIKRCLDCGESFDESEPFISTITAGHHSSDYFDIGTETELICEDCGHKFTCDHKNTYLISNEDEFLDVETDDSFIIFVYNDGNSKTHKRYTTRASKLCEDCDKHLCDIDNCTFDEPHEFKFGSNTCALCGYTKPSTVAVNKITLSKSTLTLKVGANQTLTATVAPTNATNKKVTWKSDKTSVATVANGKVTAVAPGAATITCTAADGSGVKATCKVTVEAVKVTGITLSKTSLMLDKGKSATLTATVAPTNATNNKVTWKSSDAKIATVKDGKVTAVAMGTATITCTAADGSGKSASCKVTVTDPSQTITYPTELTLGVGESSTPKATSEADKSFTYTSANKKIATVSSKGTIKGIAEGMTTITVKGTASGAKATCTVTVKKAPGKVSVSASKRTLGVGETYTLKVTLPSGSASKLTVSSSSKTIATVTAGKSAGEYIVTAKKAGTATITAKTFNGKTAKCTVTVVAAPGKVTLNATKKTLGEGETYTLKATLPSKTASALSVSSDKPDVATVKAGSKSGEYVITGVKTGSATITVSTFNKHSATCVVTVKKAPGSVSVSAASKTLGVGEKYTLKVSLPEGSASALSVKSNKTSVATVAAGKNAGEYVITAKGTGKATITAKTFNGKSAACAVTVKKAPGSVSVSAKTKTLGAGETYTLKVSLPSGSASKLTVSSNSTGVATVEAGAKTGEYIVTGVKAGSATITVKTFNGKKAECKVTVKSAPSKVSVSAAAKTLGAGETYTLKATLPDKTASVLKVSSDNTGVATVKAGKKSGEYTVTGKKAGAATITVTTFNGHSAECAVTVKAAPSKVSVSAAKKTLGVKETYTLKVSLPEGSASKLSVSSSNKSIAAVAAGKNAGEYVITGKKAGTATVTAKTFNGKKATCKVTVKAAPSKVNVSAKSKTLGVGETYTLKVSLPSGSASALTVTSGNEGIATVKAGSKSGEYVITAKKAGTATITAKTFNNKSATCKVTVKTAPDKVSVNAATKVLGKGETFTLKVSLPEGSASALTVTSSNKGIATVKAGKNAGEYVVTAAAKKTGKATITAKTFNGKSATCVVTVNNAPSKVSVNAKSKTLGVGETFTLKVSLPSGSASKLTVKSSSTSIATVAAGASAGEYVITAGKKTGTATITAKTFNGKTATCKVTVKAAPSKVNMSAKSKTLGVGETYTLKVSLPSGSASALTVTSGDEGIATVKSGSKSGEYVITAKKAGVATITAKAFNEKSATCKVTVKAAPSKVSVGATEKTLGVGEKYTLKVSLPEGSASALSVKSNKTSVATVAAGKNAGEYTITAKKAGTATITAKTFNGKTATCKVTVKKAPSKVSVSASKKTLGVGEAFTLKVSLPSGTASKLTVSSSSKSIATVATGENSGEYVITAKEVGSATITAKTFNGKTAKCAITVKKAPTVDPKKPTKLTVTPSAEQKLYIDKTLTLKATVAPTTADKTVTWASSNEKVARVKNGVVTPEGAGTATITVTTNKAAASGKKLSQSVTVNVLDPCPPTSIITYPQKTLYVGEPWQLECSIEPENAQTRLAYTNTDSSIASVGTDGVVVAKKVGKTTITVKTHNGKTTSCKIEVLDKAGGLQMERDALTLHVNDTYLLSVFAQAANVGKITFSSSNSSIVSVGNVVDGDAELTALHEGSCVITAKSANGLEATCSVIVKPAEPAVETTVAIVGNDEVTMTVGEVRQFKAQVSPSGAKTKLTWTIKTGSSQVMIDKNGRLKALRVGTAVIRVTTTDGHYDTVTIEVVEDGAGHQEAYEGEILEVLNQINLLRGNEGIYSLGVDDNLIIRAENQLEAYMDPDKTFYGSSAEIVGSVAGPVAGDLTLRMYNDDEIKAILLNKNYTNMGVALIRTGLWNAATYVIEFE